MDVCWLHKRPKGLVGSEKIITLLFTIIITLKINMTRLSNVIFTKNYQYEGACMLPCASMEVNFGVLFSDNDRNDEKSYMKIYLKSSVKFQQTIYDYTLLSLLAEMGGYMGLLLGFSLADITIFFQKSKDYLKLPEPRTV